MLYHISLEEIDNLVMFPRIPINRLFVEDKISPRISFSPSIEECLGAIPGGCNTVKNLMQFYESMDLIPLIRVLSLDRSAISKKHLVIPEVLVRENKVPDALIYREHWVTETINCTENIVLLKSFTLSEKDYIQSESVVKVETVSSIAVEHSISTKDRVLTYVLPSIESVEIIKSTALSINCSVLNINQSMNGVSVDFFVPMGVCIKPLWINILSIQWSSIVSKLSNKSITRQIAMCQNYY